MNATPVASVIIPAFQAESFLDCAIRSVLEQTLAEIEVIVVLAASEMSLWALNVSVATVPPVLVMLALMAMFPALVPPAPVAIVTLVPAFRLLMMDVDVITESAALV